MRTRLNLALIVTAIFVSQISFAQDAAKELPVLDSKEALNQVGDKKLALKVFTALGLAEKRLLALDKKNYTIDTNYSKSFKASLTQDQWNFIMQTVRGPFGNVVSRKLIKNSYTTTVKGFPDGEYVEIQYKTEFQKNRTVVETVIMIFEGKVNPGWHFAGYSID